MTKDEQRQRAETFLALHQAPPLLLLANAWDVVSAALFAHEGFKAIGTTSAGIAATLGYPDGQQIRLDDTVTVVRRLATRLDLPISADIEAGYATSIEGVVHAVQEVVDAGAVGINLEDGTGDAEAPLFDVAVQQEKIRAIRAGAASQGLPLVINARTDVYLLPAESPAARLRHAIARGNAYREAGADGIFIPDVGALDGPTIARMVREIDAPLNVVMGAGLPSLAELEELGVARVSLGPRAMRATFALLRRIARELIREGTCTTMTADTVSYETVNRWFK